MEFDIILRLTNPKADLLAVKEALAYYCEAYGDLKLISITSRESTQENIFAKGIFNK